MNQLQIKINSHSSPKNYIYSGERLNENMLTFLPVPVTDSDLRVSFEPEDIFQHSQSIEGLNPAGNVFAYKDGRGLLPAKRLIKTSPVYPKRNYLILLAEEFDRLNWSYKSSRFQDIEISKVSTLKIERKRWLLYQVTVNAITRETIDFFQRFNLRLIEAEEYLSILWPPNYAGEFITRHFGNSLWVAVPDDYSLAVYPDRNFYQSTSGNEFSCLFSSTRKRLELISNSGKNQLITFGRNQILGFTYFEKNLGKVSNYTPKVKITFEDKIIQSMSEIPLPSNCNSLDVEPEYDGKIKHIRNKTLIRIIKIKSNTVSHISELLAGDLLEIRIGLDIVTRVTIEKPIKSENAKLFDIFRKQVLIDSGREIPIPADFRELVKFTKADSVVYKWALKCIKERRVNEINYKRLKKIVMTMFGV